MKYVFRTSAYNVNELILQVGEALEERVERHSRKKLPGLWKHTDRLTGGKTPRKMSRGRRIFRRILGVIDLTVGVLMLVPGIMEPKELLVLLLTGAAAVGTGIYAICSTTLDMSPKFKKDARKLLDRISRAVPTDVYFSEDGMSIGGLPIILYGDIEYFIETQDGYFIAWGNQGTFLQKKDLIGDDHSEFASFVKARI